MHDKLSVGIEPGGEFPENSDDHRDQLEPTFHRPPGRLVIITVTVDVVAAVTSTTSAQERRSVAILGQPVLPADLVRIPAKLVPEVNLEVAPEDGEGPPDGEEQKESARNNVAEKTSHYFLFRQIRFRDLRVPLFKSANIKINW